MPTENLRYIEELMKSITYNPYAFKEITEDGKYIFSICASDPDIQDYYVISTFYDTILDLDKKIKYAFTEVTKCDFSEILNEYNPFGKTSYAEFEVIYHLENMIYRISILWDMLAQLCNIIYHTDVDCTKIHNYKYFTTFSTGDNAIGIAAEARAYFDEVENSDADINKRTGNYKVLHDYRNQMTHRVSPSITSISKLGLKLRQPILYLLSSATVDYCKVSSYICRLISNFLKEYRN